MNYIIPLQCKVMFMRWEENKLKLDKCKDPISKLSMMKPRFD